MRNGFSYTLGLRGGTFSTNFGRIFAILVLAVLTVTPKLFVEKYLMALWFMFLVIESNCLFKANRTLSKIGLLGILFVLMCIIYQLAGISSASLAYCMPEPFLYFSPIVALIIIDETNNEQQIRFLFHFISLAIAINIADNIRLSHEIGITNLAFQQLAGVMEDEGVKGLNLGSSYFVNMAVFYTGIMFMSFLKTRITFEKILFFIYFGIGAYFIVMCSMKGSAIILLLVFLALIFIASRSKGNFGKILFFALLFGTILYLFRDTFINLLITIIDNERITERLIVFTSVDNVSDSSTLMAREDLWRVSLRSWLNNPISFIFGIGDHNWEEFSSTAASGVGNHADLLDVLARYGLIGGLILYSSIKLLYDYLQKKFGSFFKWEILSFFVVLVLMGFTKKFVRAECAIAIFILFPLCLRYYYNERKL